MISLLGDAVANSKPGRPKKDAGDQETTLVRIFNEMAAKIEDLRLVLPMTTAQIVQLIGGSDLNQLHEAHKPRIEAVKAAKRALEEVQRKAQVEAGVAFKEWEQRKGSTTAKKKRPPG